VRQLLILFAGLAIAGGDADKVVAYVRSLKK
jgi:hypothetical protein